MLVFLAVNSCVCHLHSRILCFPLVLPYICFSLLRYTPVGFIDLSLSSYFYSSLSSSVFCVSIYEVLNFSLYRNFSISSFLLSSMGGSFASTGEVLKTPVYIFMPFFNVPADAVLYSWQP